MGFRFQRRINIGNGVGLNLSKSGIGASMRGRNGSVGTSGFSIRTGIPGLSFRQSWGKRSDGAAVAIILGFLALAALAVVAVVQVLLWLIPVLVNAGRWCYLTTQDYITFLRTGSQPIGDAEATEIADEQYDPNEKTLAEILADEGDQKKAQGAPLSSPARPPPAASVQPPVVVQVVPSSTSSVAAIVGAAALGLAVLLGMCRWSGDTAEPQFDAADLSAWRTVMLDEKQPASVRLSNAEAIIHRFPGTGDASTASSLRTQLSNASAAESIARNAEAAARAAERQALLDRKERRPTPPPPPMEVDNDVASAIGAGAVGAALLSRPTDPRRAASYSNTSVSPASETSTAPQPRAKVRIGDGSCPCSGAFNCTGPRGGSYCITSGGDKRYR